MRLGSGWEWPPMSEPRNFGVCVARGARMARARGSSLPTCAWAEPCLGRRHVSAECETRMETFARPRAKWT
eukprot:4452876-Alexandrium_andersonii.AAC.1